MRGWCFIGVGRVSGLFAVVMLAACVAQRPQAQVDYVTAYYAALAAYERSDYDAALMMFRQLASKGDALSQLYVGSMYERGEGAAKDEAAAVHWYRRAAEQGNVDAQVNLAEMYSTGSGVDRDTVHAYAWWSVAATLGEQSALSSRSIIAQHMSPQQIKEADGRADEILKSLSTVMR